MFHLIAGHAFGGFSEQPITFNPSYKFDPGTDHYDTSEKQRVPSWTVSHFKMLCSCPPLSKTMEGRHLAPRRGQSLTKWLAPRYPEYNFVGSYLVQVTDRHRNHWVWLHVLSVHQVFRPQASLCTVQSSSGAMSPCGGVKNKC